MLKIKNTFLNGYCIVFCTVLNDIPEDNDGSVIISEKEVVWKKFNPEGKAIDLAVEKIIIIKNLTGTEKEKIRDLSRKLVRRLKTQPRATPAPTTFSGKQEPQNTSANGWYSASYRE
ncbi:hypothetical protein DZJ_17290 [Dickeya ananatis]